MGDMGDVFNGWKEHKRIKRATNRDASASVLTASKIEFQSRNGGAHLIVTHNGFTVDFWPGTGKWIFRHIAKCGRGVANLIRALG